MVSSCVDDDNGDAKVMKPFIKSVEATEKTSISFVLGSLGAHFAARLWVAGWGDVLDAMLHVGIYAKATLVATPLVNFKPSGGKWPDFLVHTKGGRWHIFESKGGSYAKRHARIVEGLAQLAQPPLISWTVGSPSPATSCVCVHTSTDSKARLKFTAVDPPGDALSLGELPPVKLIGAVCDLLLVLETIDQFRALTAIQVDPFNLPESDWVEAESTAFGGLTLSIPTRFLVHEGAIRARVATFLAIREVYDSPIFWTGEVKLRPPLNVAIENVLAAQISAEDRNQYGWEWLDTESPSFLEQCSERLGLDILAAKVARNDSDITHPEPMGQTADFTASDLFIEENPRLLNRE
jgi:hypothetical protein